MILTINISSCDCNDCGPTGELRYYMVNKTDSLVLVTWYGNPTLPSNIIHEFTIDSGDEVLLYESSIRENKWFDWIITIRK